MAIEVTSTSEHLWVCVSFLFRVDLQVLDVGFTTVARRPKVSGGRLSQPSTAVPPVQADLSLRRATVVVEEQPPRRPPHLVPPKPRSLSLSQSKSLINFKRGNWTCFIHFVAQVVFPSRNNANPATSF